MPTQALPNIPAGSHVFLDANILIYALTKTSAECEVLLERCALEEIIGVTSFQVVAEVTHRLMLEEARSRGMASLNPRRTLREHPERVKQLTAYWGDIDRLLAMNLLFVTTHGDTIRAAHQVRARFGLLTNDSLVVASMRLYDISMLATRDADFDRVTDVIVYSPTDV
jgi:predicted nucleic acid-binding protein